MEGLLFFRVYPSSVRWFSCPSDGFRFILIPDGNPSHEFPVLDGNPSSNMNSANNKTIWQNCSPMAEILTMSMIDKFRI